MTGMCTSHTKDCYTSVRPVAPVAAPVAPIVSNVVSLARLALVRKQLLKFSDKQKQEFNPIRNETGPHGPTNGRHRLRKSAQQSTALFLTLYKVCVYLKALALSFFTNLTLLE